jgi:hypothetical protein
MTNSLLISVFCASCKPEIVLPVLQIKSKQKQFHIQVNKTSKFTKNQLSDFGIIDLFMLIETDPHVFF